GSWDKAASSLTTGESAWAELYDQPNFGGKVLRVGPNTTICNLSEVSIDNRNFNKAISSVRLFDARPKDWPGSSVSTRRYFTMSDVRRYSINKNAKSLTESVLGLIPEVGGVLSGIVSALWPFGANRADVWIDMNAWVTKLLEDMMQHVAGQIANNEIAGLANLISQYIASRSERDFQALYSHVLVLESKFTNPVDPPSVLPQITLFGTVALAIYREAYFNYDSIFTSKPSESDKDYRKKKLETAIASLRDSVAKGYRQALDRRLAKIKQRQDKVVWGLFGGSYTAWDDYTHWSKKFSYTDEHKRRTAEINSRDAFNYARGRAEQTFAAEFDTYLEVADLWTYFDRAGPVSPSKEWRQVTMGMWGGFFGPVSPNHHGVGVRDFSGTVGRGGKITSVTLYAEKGGDFVRGLGFDIDGKPAAVWGKQGKSSIRIDVAANERITGVFGAWGDLVHYVTVRKQAFTGNGEASAWPTETGMGKDGGRSFSASGPDGADGVLSGLICQLSQQNYHTEIPEVLAVGTCWSYERTVPRK
ncbi:MAG TPA: hypothetical protein VLX44_13515, partial [Xanthobacteraceae bacterium]|nr:hypothetical protein [Xanthobacteraceae bacterium]